MDALSQEERTLLEWFRGLPKGYAPGNKLPEGQYDRVQSMLRKQYLQSFVLVAPGMEKESFGNFGLLGYKISPEGIDALALDQQRRDEHAANEIKQHLQEQREKERDRKDSIRLALEIIGVIISFLAGVVLQNQYDLLGLLEASLRLLGSW